jgi:hypothetical protein
VFYSPVELNILARRDLANRRVAADRWPDLDLELAFSNIIAEELVIYHSSVSSSQHNLGDTHSSRSDQETRRHQDSVRPRSQ